MVLKRGLILAIFLALFVIFMQIDNGIKNNSVNNNILITFSNATIYNIGENYSSLRAKNISRYKNKDEFVALNIEFLNKKKQAYILSANSGISKNGIIHLQNNIIVKIANISTLTTKELFYDEKTKILYNNKQFKITYDTHSLEGKNLFLNISTNEFSANNIRFKLKKNKKIQ